jgi:glycerol-3-phosphate acyltransferase PlsY
MQTKFIIDIALIIFAYLLGSISSAIVVCKIMRLPDPRTEGSGNPGATNVLRLGGKKAAIITLLGDILKGVIPVLIARAVGLTDLALALVACAAFVGHLFPIFFGFQGGKGVATAFGAVVALSWIVGFSSLGIWIIFAVAFRYASLASICAAISMPIFGYFLANKTYTIPLIIMCIIVLWKHRANVVRIVQGKESRLGQRS